LSQHTLTYSPIIQNDDTSANTGWSEYVEWCSGFRMRTSVTNVTSTSGMRAMPMRSQKW
jgi:hypothetical protein